MADIVYVSKRLVLWAEWRARKSDNGIGYPRRSAFVKTVSGGQWTLDIDSHCIDVDKCVCALEADYRAVIMECYTAVGTKEAKSRRLQISVKTFDNRLVKAHHEILGLLNDLAAGIPLPTYVQTSVIKKIKNKA